jgi:hypothetical protein
MKGAVDRPVGGCLKHQSGSAHSEALWLGSQCIWLMLVLLRRTSACPSALPPPLPLGLALPALSCRPVDGHTTDHLSSWNSGSGTQTPGKRAGLREVNLGGQGAEERGVAGACPGWLQRSAQVPWAWTSQCHQSAVPLCTPLCQACPAHSNVSTSSDRTESAIQIIAKRLC